MAVRELETRYLVVGAGAAGSSFGYLLRREGCDVLALELREARGKSKLCGGILGEAATSHLRAIYGNEAISELAPFRPQRVVKRVLGCEVEWDESLVAMPRKRLDDWLLERYLGEGGALLDRVRLDAVDMATRIATAYDLRTHDTLRISFDAIIGADGATSALRRILCGRGQRFIATVEGSVARVDDDIIFAYKPGCEGYCWYIPTGDGANVGCGAYGCSAQECRSWLAEFCAESGFEPTSLRGAPIPTGDDVLLAPAEGAWLVGDAAGLIMPFNSGGIHLAFSSARRLAASLLGGPSYRESMSQTVERIGHDAEHVRDFYFRTALYIVKKGHPYTTGASSSSCGSNRS